MKSSSKSLTMVSVLFVVSAGGCVLIGYDLTGYDRAEDAGKGGGGSAPGEGGAGPSSGSTSSTATSSSSSGMSCPECNDNNPCTKDTCMSGKCTNKPLPAQDDGNACTLDTCDKDTGMFPHKLMPGCCAHSACISGNGPLDPLSCNPQEPAPSCVTVVCGVRPQCCNTRWDANCIAQAKISCVAVAGSPPTPYTCKCSHPYCVAGEALDPTCDPCVNEICKINPTCCTKTWDPSCIGATTTLCGIPVDAPCEQQM